MIVCRLSARRSGFRDAAAAAPLTDLDDDELGGLDRVDADLHIQASGIAGFHGVVGRVACHIERGIRSLAEEHSRSPLQREERPNVAPDFAPQALIVWLEYRPLRATVQRLLEEVEHAADVDVFPGRIAGCGDRAGAPHQDAPSGERTDTVD